MCKRDYKVFRKCLFGFYCDVISSNFEEFGNWVYRGCGKWIFWKYFILLVNKVVKRKVDRFFFFI